MVSRYNRTEIQRLDDLDYKGVYREKFNQNRMFRKERYV